MRRTVRFLPLTLAVLLVLLLTGLLVTRQLRGPSVDATADTVAVIGDSLTDMSGRGATLVPADLGAADRGEDGTYVWGVGGKRLLLPDSQGKTTLQNIADARAQVGPVAVWVIALGTNDTLSTETAARFETDVEKILAAVGSDRFVWINLAFWAEANTNASRFNPVLERSIAKHRNGRYADWNAYVHDPVREADDLWLHTTTEPSDYTHMTDKGYDLRAKYYADQVAAVPPDG